MENNQEPLSDFEKLAAGLNKNPNEDLNEMLSLDDISIVEDNVELPKKSEEVSSSPMEQVAKESAPKEEVVPKTDNFKFQENLNMVDNTLPKTNEEVKTESINTNSDQTIGTIKPDKQKSPVAMLVLFSILVLFILFMPYILTFVNEKFGTNFETHSGVNVPTVVDSSESETQKVSMYDLNSSTVISVDKVDFKNFEKSDEDGYKLIFYVKNNGTTLYSFDKKVYLDYFDSSNTFIGRSYLENVKDITGGIENKYVVEISDSIYQNATKVELVLRTSDDYPSVEVKNNQITCSTPDDTIVYTFENDRLVTIRDMYTYTKGVDITDYSSDLLSYKSRMSNLDALDGVTAVLTETDSGFITSILIDYQNADYKEVSSNKNYYMKDTYARVINFEMSAKNYTCR